MFTFGTFIHQVNLFLFFEKIDIKRNVQVIVILFDLFQAG